MNIDVGSWDMWMSMCDGHGKERAKKRTVVYIARGWVGLDLDDEGEGRAEQGQAAR